MNIWRQLRAILLLPGMVTVVIPATILYFTGIPQPMEHRRWIASSSFWGSL